MDNASFVETFKDEAYELLASLESQLLLLEKNPTDKEVLSAVFRVMHTIKGSAAMFGLDRISSFAHEVESILTALRDGILPFSKPIIDFTLIARDHILLMLDDTDGSGSPSAAELDTFLSEFRVAVGFQPVQSAPAASMGTEPGSPGPAKAPAQAATVEPQTWHINFKPFPEVLARGLDPLRMISELQGFGETVIIPDFTDVPPVSRLSADTCHTGWDIFLTTGRTLNEIRDVFIFIEGACELTIQSLSDMADEEFSTSRKLGKILVDSGKLDARALDRVLQSQKRLGEVLVEQKLVSRSDVTVALQEQKIVQKCQKDKATSVDMNTIRVKSEKLDALMSLVGELVTVHARILESTKQLDGAESLSSVVELFGRLTDDLRSNTMSIRMVPVGSTFSGFKRLVRDLSGELGKHIELETSGGDTELDKSVIEKLHDPLVHIIRNSLDHGIESPEIRKERGKGETGFIRLSASQSGASVYITIEDDGNGLDRARILKKAAEKGLIKPDAQLTDDEAYRLIFLPGFSTKDVVTSVSGRGVGMDVVNRQMEVIGGTVGISSVPGKGTKITLKIPLTLAIIDGLLARVGSEYYVFPLSVVEGCIEFDSAKQAEGNQIVVYHGHQVPFVDLHDFFCIPGDRDEYEQMIIVRAHENLYGLVVDRILGGNQTVIKPLGTIYKRAKGVSSATIRGDGSIALILDVEEILKPV